MKKDIKQLANSAKLKYASVAAGVAAASSTALADNIWDSAVTALTGLLVGVAAVGAAGLAIVVSAVGFKVIKKVIWGT